MPPGWGGEERRGGKLGRRAVIDARRLGLSYVKGEGRGGKWRLEER